MLKKITKINDFRVFKGWSGEPAAVDFGTVNLVYGVNGSGKSTLASLLAAAPDDSGWTTGLRVTVLDDDGRASTVSTPDHSIWQSVRVFNSDFVSANLRFDTGGDSHTAPLLVLGKAQIDREERVGILSARLAEIATDLPVVKTKRAKAIRDRDALATRTATLIVEELQSVGGRYAARSYDARKVKQVLATATDPSKSYDLASELEVARSPSMPLLAVSERQSFATKALEAAVEALLQRKAFSRPIDALRSNPKAARWVQEGIELHEAGGSCLFCSGSFTTERLAELEQHFDESLRALQADVRGVLAQLDRAAESLTDAFGLLPGSQELHADLRAGWSTAKMAVETDSAKYGVRLEYLRQLVTNKGAHLFTAQEMPGALRGLGELHLTPLANLLIRHNELVESAGSRRLEAADRVERQRIEAIRDEYDTLNGLVDEATDAIGPLEAEQKELQEQLRALAQEDMDAVPLAQSLNNDLARLLGRNDLTFSLSEEGYSIRRGGEPALYLSEGEKTAISLLYFLKSLDAHGGDRAKAIVVIDDPVSSLDSNVVAGVSAHLWARLVGQGKCKQLFILTHSFELFRSWGNLIDRLPDPVRRGEKITDTMQELRVRMIVNADGSVSRRPFLIPWPSKAKDRNRIRSEYHYLFWRAANTLQECQDDPTPDRELDAAAILPNICRRMLEGFLSFKYPAKIGDFRGLVEEAIGNMDNSVTRTRLVTFLHQYSHNEEGDISKPINRPESISILGSVFELIRHVDPDHYEKMCAALAVDPHLVGV